MRRRTFLQVASLGAALPLLQACAPPTLPASATPTTGGRGANVFPTYLPTTNGPKPDFASAGQQYEDGFANYPQQNPASWTKGPPAAGSAITVLSQARGVGGNAPATPVDQNPAWQEINRQLNANVQYTITPVPDYGTKLAAVMSGSDLPDIILFQGGLGGTNATSTTVGASATTNLPAFLEHSMADLTPYLAGDAVKAYPNLAAIPTFAWKNSGCVYNGKIYMWPVERYRPLNMLFRNTALWDKELGVNYVPTDAADFKRALQQLTHPSTDVYGIVGTNIPYNLQVFPALFGAPNGWALDASGKLTKDIETPQFRDSIAYVRDLVAAGVYYPDSLIAPASNAGPITFSQGKGALIAYTFGVNWSTLWTQAQAANPPVGFAPLGLFPAQAGGPLRHFLGPGFIVTNGMKRASPERIQEVLRVVDWLAAPFGSAEDLLLTYGLKDVEYTLDAMGHPVQNKGAAADTQAVPWQYIVQHPQVMFFPNYADYAKQEYDAEHMLIPAGVEDPTWGYFSAAASTQGPVVGQLVLDTLTDILVGRRDMSDYDPMVKDWQSKGGNQIRSELEAALAAGS